MVLDLLHLMRPWPPIKTALEDVDWAVVQSQWSSSTTSFPIGVMQLHEDEVSTHPRKLLSSGTNMLQD